MVRSVLQRNIALWSFNGQLERSLSPPGGYRLGRLPGEFGDPDLAGSVDGEQGGAPCAIVRAGDEQRGEGSLPIQPDSGVGQLVV